MNTKQTPNPKCSCCECYWKPDETDIKTSGLPFKTCKKCRVRQTDKMVCECGAVISRRHIARHMKSGIHTKQFIIDGTCKWIYDKWNGKKLI